jgi:thimet oligopeptidase
MYIEYNNRAYPPNIDVLRRMLIARAELARLIGYRSWTEYVTADKIAAIATGAPGGLFLLHR